MSPTLQDDTVVVLFKLPHVFNCVPEYGDIVAIDPRSHRSRSVSDDFIDTFETMIHKIKGAAKSENIWGKRVIGLPGDTIEFLDGSHVFRNGIQLEEPYLLEPMNYRNMHTYVVPDNSIFVLGDNRNHSIDSRYIGFIPIDHVLGRVIKL